jgi:DNA topoisomerase-1
MPVLDSSSDDDDVPLAQRVVAAAAAAPPAPAPLPSGGGGNEGEKKPERSVAPAPAPAPAAAPVVVKPYVAPPIQSPTTNINNAKSAAPAPAAAAAEAPKQPAAPVAPASANGGSGGGFVIPKRPRADSSSSDDDVPLAQRAKAVEQAKKPPSAATTKGEGGVVIPKAKPAVPEVVRPVQSRPMMVPQIAKNPNVAAASKGGRPVDSSDSDDDAPLAQKKKSLDSEKRTKEERERRRREKKERKRKRKEKRREERRRREAERLGGGRHTVKLNSSSGVKKKKSSSGGSSRRASAGGNGKGQEIMWTQLEHQGVLFPPEYEPHGVPLTYDGKDVYLEPHEEEVATFFAVMKETDYAFKPVFQQNFMDGFRRILKGGKNAHITDFEKCNFQKIYDWDLARREKVKARTSEEKKQIKLEKDKAEEKYMWATMNGKREQVGNFRVEPPGLFRGRGEHPKMGRIKRRIQPEDIIINIGKDAKVPEPPAGHRWKEVRHDQTVTWMAGWNDSINTKDWKYVQFGATSSVKSESDKQKFEKARTLHEHIGKIRDDYRKNMRKDNKETAQLAVTTYLVDKLALRAGGEKDEDLADTVGVTTLRVGHLKFMGPDDDHPYPKIEFDFLGKDSIRYHQEHAIERVAYDCLKRFCKNKKEDEDVFDKIDPSKVNSHLQTLMPGLTIKVFRTYNASITLYRLLEETTKPKAAVPIMKATYDEANKEVAILCNHQKGESKQHQAGMDKLNDKKKDLEKELKELRKADKNHKKIPSLKERIEKLKIQMETKESLKTVSLGTSKINYLDPRITIAWCKKNEVPLPTVYTKALVQKFNWAMCEEPDYVFADLSYNIEKDPGAH